MTGVIWYQGETNAAQPQNYGDLLTTFMADWREKFGESLSFVVIQLPNFGDTPDAPTQSNWAELREQQRLAVLEDDNAALVVTIDVGDPLDIHPVDKKPVAERTAFAMRRLIYEDNEAPSSPSPVSTSREGDEVIIRFANVEGALVSPEGAEITAFELCNESVCRFVSAKAEADRVALKVPTDFAPTKVRYAWADSPKVSLIDVSGMPATPFEMQID